MILKSIQPINYGPFGALTTLEVEPTVTVLTGPNDTGKSSLLKLISHICKPQGPNTVEEGEYNQDHIHESKTVWNQADDFGCIATFQTTDGIERYFGQPNVTGAKEVELRINIAPLKPSWAVTQFTGQN